MHCDVAVIGAGAAGIAAAVAAAKAGAQTVIIERHSVIGGLATSALVGTICGLYYRHPTTPRYAIQGFARDFAEAIQIKSQTTPALFAEGLHFLPYRPDVFHQEALRQLQQTGVQILLQALVTGVETHEKQICALHGQTRDQAISVYPTAVVDCSGNAQLSVLTGIETIKQAYYQAGAFVFQVSGLPAMSQEVLNLNIIRWLKRGIQTGQLHTACERLSLIPGTLTNGMALLKLAMPMPFDGSNTCLQQYEHDAHTCSSAIVDYLNKTEPLLANLIITQMASEVGIRTSERSHGLAILTENHVLSCAKPDDGVAIGAWPIEYWGAERKPTLRYFAIDDGYWLSAGTLVSCHLDNLFFAGRNLSATEPAIASARVIGTCLSTGYAAGSLAASYAETGRWQAAIHKIRRQQIFAEPI